MSDCRHADSLSIIITRQMNGHDYSLKSREKENKFMNLQICSNEAWSAERLIQHFT